MSEETNTTELIFRVDVCCLTPNRAYLAPILCMFQGTLEGAEYVTRMLARRGFAFEITAQDVEEKYATALVQAEFKVWPPVKTELLCEMIRDKNLWRERDRWAEFFNSGIVSKEEARRLFVRELQEAND